MVFGRIKKNKDNYEVNLFYNDKSKSHYRNLITRDPRRIAQLLLDLTLEGFPINEAIRIMRTRMKEKDWLGI